MRFTIVAVVLALSTTLAVAQGGFNTSSSFGQSAPLFGGSDDKKAQKAARKEQCRSEMKLVAKASKNAGNALSKEAKKATVKACMVVSFGVV